MGGISFIVCFCVIHVCSLWGLVVLGAVKVDRCSSAFAVVAASASDWSDPRSNHLFCITRLLHTETKMPVVVVMIQDLHLQKILWKNWVWSISTLRSLLKKRGYSLLLLTTNNIFTEEGVIDLGVSRALESKTFLSQVPGGYSIWFLRPWVWVRTRMLPESCDITVGVAAYWALASALLPIRVLLVHSLCGSWNGWQTNNKGPGYFHSASQSKWVNCSSQPSIVHWLSSSIFPCRLFVRSSRHGDT